MSLPTTYKIGTASVVRGSKEVSGSDTNWLYSDLRAGDIFWLGGVDVTIASFNSAASLTLDHPWTADSATNTAYEIRYVPDANRVLESTRELLQKLLDGEIISFADVKVQAGPAGSLPTYADGVLTFPVGTPGKNGTDGLDGKNGAVDFGDINLATGQPSSEVAYNPVTETLTIPRGVPGDTNFTSQLDNLSKEVRDGRAAADALLDPDPWPGDDAVHAIADNGIALATMADGTTRGTFLADDIFSGINHTVLRTREANRLMEQIPTEYPGDEGQIIAVAQNGIAAMWDSKGRLRGTHVVEKPGWPGDWIMPLVVDSRDVVVEGYDIRDGSDYQIGIGLSGWPGDFIIPLETDRTGRVARGYDIRDGSPYPAAINGGGASVEFVDPGIAGDAWGAVADAKGVIKFMSRMWQGEVIGFEKRGDEVLADTGSVATGIVAIGGGDIGQARSQRDYPWHVLDEALDYTGASNGADAAAAAYLDIEGAAYRARPTVISLAEVIGSTVEADVLPSAPRRVQLINRVRTASTALEAWDKLLVVDRIKLDLLDGAPATAELTADNHYAAVGNGLRLEVAEATGQALLPVLMVNQGFGTRDDGTSPVILAEGRLDWNHFALGFVIPTPLYPFDLKPGTPATLTESAALMVSEIEALALEAISAGGEWFCPSLEEATISGTTITARFVSMSALTLRDAANHGFTISGENNTAVSISNVSVSGAFVIITLDAVPDGTPVLNYAFGQTGDPGDGKAANRGSLTDSWSVPSRAVLGETLYRYARSGRATIQSGA